MEGVRSVLEDPTFAIPSRPASSTREVAEYLSSWMPEHSDVVRTFEAKLICLLSSCINVQQSSLKASHEKMWSSYHTLRVSEEYVTEWNTFITESGCSVSPPIFYQHVGHYVFKKIIKKYHLIKETAPPRETPFNPTYKELNSIRYAAGWVARTLKKKLPKSSHPLKEDLWLCLRDLLDDGDDDQQESKEWVEAVDCGGLTQINNITFELFWAMEKALRTIVSASPVSHIPEECNEMIKNNDDVKFIWCLMSSDWAEASGKVLLEMIINEWTKIRGFSYASTWVEKFKSEQRKTTQKRKGLRKQLQTMPSRAKKARVERPSD